MRLWLLEFSRTPDKKSIRSVQTIAGAKALDVISLGYGAAEAAP